MEVGSSKKSGTLREYQVVKTWIVKTAEIVKGYSEDDANKRSGGPNAVMVGLPVFSGFRVAARCIERKSK